MPKPDPADLLRDAQSAPEYGLAPYRRSITALRHKGYTWRQVADFLKERGISTDHTTIYRFMHKEDNLTMIFAVPPAAAYAKALVELNPAPHEMAMLRAHYEAPNRTITYTELARAVGWKNYGGTNLHYGYLGRRLGEELGMSFVGEEEDEPFYSSAIGMGTSFQQPTEHFKFVMHHELAKALQQLGWFESN